MKAVLGLFLFLVFIAHIECLQLKFVQALWRNGDTAPEGLSYPKNKNNETKWSRGWGQLTHKGIGQLLDVGSWLNKRYAGNFTSRKFIPSEINLRSNSEDSSLTTSQVLLNGFYPPFGEYVFHHSVWHPFTWQPFPVHSNAEDKDPLLKPTSFECPTYDAHLTWDEPQFETKQREKYSVVFDFVGQISGLGHGLSYDDFTRLNDLNQEINHNFTQPEWVKKEFDKHEFRTVPKIAQELYYLKKGRLFGNKLLAKLRGGYLLGDWLKRAQAVIKGKQEKPSKMALYFSNEDTFMALASTLNITDTVDYPIPYGSGLIMEVWENDGIHAIEIYYRAGDSYTRVEIPNCEEICTWNDFVKLTRGNAIFEEKDLYRECNIFICDPKSGKPLIG